MKRFVIKSRTLGDVFVKVDDGDAYLLRSVVWSACRSHAKAVTIQRAGVGSEPITLGGYLLNARGGEIVGHRNGDSSDFTRDNLFITDSRKGLFDGRATLSQPKLAKA